MAYSILSLGDSYTIGESVLLIESFPYQVVQMLRKKGMNFCAPEIIAKTGWTTDELQTAVQQYTFSKDYDWVTLLIGVNNQYRGRPVEEYGDQFEHLLQKAIGFAGKRPERVIVVSIPDWGVTPFAAGRDQDQIAREIDQFNSVNESISRSWNVHYINITPGSRIEGKRETGLASDGLHPSAKEYTRWATPIYELIFNKIHKNL